MVGFVSERDGLAFPEWISIDLEREIQTWVLEYYHFPCELKTSPGGSVVSLTAYRTYTHTHRLGKGCVNVQQWWTAL